MRKESNLKLSIALKRTGVARNIIYLKKVSKPINIPNTLDNFVEHRRRQSKDSSDHDENRIYEDN